MLSRRQFLAATVAAVAAITTSRFVFGSEESAVIAVLRKRLNYLVLDGAGLHAFAKELVGRNIVSSRRLRLIDVAGSMYSRLEMSSYDNAFARELRHGEERLVSLYLLSSDFFLNGADFSKIVRYRDYYDPIQKLQSCNNPFSRPVVSSPLLGLVNQNARTVAAKSRLSPGLRPIN